MTVPADGGRQPQREPTGSISHRAACSTSRRATGSTLGVGPIEHTCCCLVGILAAATVAVLLYPVLVAVTRPLGVLSSTALLYALLVVWIGIWSASAIAWSWRKRSGESVRAR
ncbi:MAG: hypothetical protein ACOCR0_01405 [Haloferacaceae archaeon]